MKATGISPEFVEFIPSTLVEGILYISETYKTAAHLCCCGCGIKIVTPINETGWRLTRKGGRVTLHPSIGNWNHPCQSHYWIKGDRVVWSAAMTPHEIARGRALDRARSDAYFAKNKEVKIESGSRQLPPGESPSQQQSKSQPKIHQNGLWIEIKRFIKSLFR